MAFTAENYRKLFETGQIYPTGTTTWESNATWGNWTTWNSQYSQQIVTYFVSGAISPIPINFTLRINTDANCPITYEVYTSSTGAYAGEEVKTTIAPGASSVAAFYGTTFIVAVIANAGTGIPIINSISFEYTSAGEKELTFTQVNTSTLSGTSSSRTLPLNTNIGGVSDVQIQPFEVTAYNLDVYVTNTPTSTYLLPKVISSTSTSLTFALVGIDNQPRDGVVNINLKCLPLQFMDGNNLVSN
jgi:hypothetical protein